MRLFHGGPPGLRPGDTIEPPAQGDTRHLVDGCPTCEARRAGTPLEGDDLTPGLIYVTTDRDYAAIYAHGYPRGAVYQVTTDAPLTPSADPAPAWSCSSATVTTVIDPLVQRSPHDLRRLSRRYLGADSPL